MRTLGGAGANAPFSAAMTISRPAGRHGLTCGCVDTAAAAGCCRSSAWKRVRRFTRAAGECSCGKSGPSQPSLSSSSCVGRAAARVDRLGAHGRGGRVGWLVGVVGHSAMSPSSSISVATTTSAGGVLLLLVVILGCSGRERKEGRTWLGGIGGGRNSLREGDRSHDLGVREKCAVAKQRVSRDRRGSPYHRSMGQVW